ncbi:hypothetical protein [Fulvimarina sp. MAC3]|uniref:hypothetical protein n=1 Tax=Fulvimarina sp. MAC3 TaxID=3148887 RepID=UPI0031FC478E
MNRPIDSSYYRLRAEECGEQAGSSTLANVREKILTSQKAWQEMADRASEREESARTAHAQA